jgi:hypothetical protein
VSNRTPSISTWGCSSQSTDARGAVDDASERGAGGGQQQRFTCASRQPDRVVLGQRVRVCTSSIRSSANRGSHGDVGVVDRQVHDGGVEVAGSDPWEQVGGVALVHGDVHTGVTCSIWAAAGGAATARWCRSSRTGPRRVTSSPRDGHVGGDVLELVEHPPGPFDHHHPLVGEPTTLAVDEHHAELLLERAMWPLTLDWTV